MTWFEAMPPGSLQGLVFATDDAVGAYATLRARGVPFEGPVRKEPWGRRAVFRDPDGNGLVLVQAP